MLANRFMVFAAKARAGWLLLAVLMAAACGANSDAKDSAAGPEAALAVIGDETITVAEVKHQLDQMSPYDRARFASLEQKKHLLEGMVRVEVLAQEAERRGFGDDPDVVRTMKTVMIQKMMADELAKITPESVPVADMRAYYEAHKSRFHQDAQVRVAAIIVASKATAARAAAEAKGPQGKSLLEFRKLVSSYSTDIDTRTRGGDLRYFSKDTDTIPAPVVTAAFALERIGDVAGPIATDDGRFYIIRLTGTRDAVDRPFEAVKRQIQNRLYRDRRKAAQGDLIARLKGSTKIVIHDDRLAGLSVASDENPAPAKAAADPKQPVSPPQ